MQTSTTSSAHPSRDHELPRAAGPGPMLRPQYHFRSRAAGALDAWWVPRLLRAAEHLPLNTVDPKRFAELDQHHWGDTQLTPNQILEHTRLINAADTRFPIILDADGRIMDGMHRVCRAVLDGQSSLPARQFTTDPEPDVLDTGPDKLPYPRTILARLAETDLTAFQNYRTNPDLARYQGWEVVDDEAAREFLRQMSEEPFLAAGQWSQLAVYDWQSQRLIGDIGLCKRQNELEIGYTLHHEFHGQGYASEAVQMALALCLDEHPDLETVVAYTDPQNAPSIRLLERVGFQRSANRDADGDQCFVLNLTGYYYPISFTGRL